MLGREVLSISTPRPVLPVLVGSRLSQSRVSLSFWERCCQAPPSLAGRGPAAGELPVLP